MNTIAALALTATLLQSTPSNEPASPWKDKLAQYAVAHLDHPAWGVAHARRDIRVTLELARTAKIDVDEDAITAAAYLHDIGAIEGFAKPGVEHMQRALELIDPILEESGFPMSKAPLVRTIVSHHMYYSETKDLPIEAILFRDADTLDFLGTIGAVRIFALTGKHRWALDVDAAEATVRKHADELPKTLTSDAAKRIAADRVIEMHAFLEALAREK